MALPIPDDDPRPAEETRPDWLVGAGEDMPAAPPQAPRRPLPPTLRPVPGAEGVAPAPVADRHVAEPPSPAPAEGLVSLRTMGPQRIEPTEGLEVDRTQGREQAAPVEGLESHRAPGAKTNATAEGLVSHRNTPVHPLAPAEGLESHRAPTARPGASQDPSDSYESAGPASGPPVPAPAPATTPSSGWPAAASSVPVVRTTRRRTINDLDEPESAGLEIAPARVIPQDRATKPAPPRAPREPLWLILLDELRTNRIVHVALGSLMLIGTAFVVWPRDNGLAIARIRQNAAHYDGIVVEVEGRVGQVFRVGEGHAFYLHQRRDTIVVFTRSRVPEERSRIRIRGEISTGYLDGAPRPSLFEIPAAPAGS